MLGCFMVIPVWQAHAAEADKPGAGNKKTDKTLQPEDDDFTSTPFTEYGEFNEDAEEAEESKFFQQGRFFGVSLRSGYEGLTGNRGQLWRGGFPVIDVKVHYWFDFTVAIDIGINSVKHYYEGTSTAGRTDISMFQMGLDVKYYFDTRNLSAALTAAHPYVLAGIASFSKNESSDNDKIVNSDSGMGFAAGGGLEFAIKQKKIYLSLEGKYHFINFKDTYTQNFIKTHSLPDLTGGFYQTLLGIMFTW
ncbi:MAG: hypothetical protein A2583_16280 [Bdellovibrionales bacterium RIFOXYD1_FULL_53_11]|nr:MAG: hypothetical protein A2583_16280 [Bdellovibrionales bacterium RIFOXYD1_FULL_53_11]